MLLRFLICVSVIVGLAAFPLYGESAGTPLSDELAASASAAGLVPYFAQIGLQNDNSDNLENESCEELYDDNDNRLGTNMIKESLEQLCDLDKASNDNELTEAAIAKETANRQAALAKERSKVETLARAGRETLARLPDKGVVLRLLPTLAQDLHITLRPVDPSEVPPLPDRAVKRFLFEIVAETAEGMKLNTLPVEANLSATLKNEEVSGLDKAKLVLALLDRKDDQWKIAPKPMADPRNNFVSATINQMGIYGVIQE